VSLNVSLCELARELECKLVSFQAQMLVDAAGRTSAQTKHTTVDWYLSVR